MAGAQKVDGYGRVLYMRCHAGCGQIVRTHRRVCQMIMDGAESVAIYFICYILTLIRVLGTREDCFKLIWNLNFILFL